MHHASEAFKRSAQPFLSGERETYATVLLGIMLTVYGAECLNWDPVTVQAEVKQDFEVDMPSVVFDQLMALINALSTDAVYTSVDVFDQTINAFCRNGLNDADMPSVEELAWSVFELTMNDPDPYEKVSEWPFSRDIATYCGVVLADAGINRPPATLAFADMPSWAPNDLSEDPALFAGAWHKEVTQAQDIDLFVRKHFEQLTEHLSEIGLEPAPVAEEAAEDQLPENPLDQMLGR